MHPKLAKHLERFTRRPAYFLPILFFGLQGFAFGEDGDWHFCSSAYQIEPHIQTCENNDLLVKYGDNCMAHLNQEVEATVNSLNANLKTGAAQQKGDFSHALANGKLSVAQIDRLILITETAIRDIKPYQDVILIPEDVDVPEITGPDPKAWAESIPCYGETKESITFLQSMFEKRLQEFKVAKQAAQVIQKNSGSREVTVSSESLTKQVAKGPAIGSVKRKPAGKFDQKPSDITGGAVDAKKREEGQNLLGNPK